MYRTDNGTVSALFWDDHMCDVYFGGTYCTFYYGNDANIKKSKSCTDCEIAVRAVF